MSITVEVETSVVEQSTSWVADCLKVANWARAIGLDVRQISDTNFPNTDIKPFFPDIWLDRGKVYYNEKTHPGDLLHELGHLAVTPSWLRPYLKGNVEDWTYNTSAEMQALEDEHKDDPFFGCYGDEMAAIAWSYAAACAADIDDFLPFEQGFEINGEGTGEQLYESLNMSAIGQYTYHDGIYHLVYFGMLQAEKQFPNLCKWILD
jgi:hypothetical protein